MQLITLLSTAAMVATVSATAERTAVTLNADCDYSQPYARVINRCDYDVYLWSVYKGDGCPTSGMVTLKTGDTYAENYPESTDSTGVSIKLSKSETCGSDDITQLEYYLEKNNPGFDYNYLDVSYVNCGSEDCPTRQDGYYLVAGNQTGAATAGSDNTWCPVMSCSDAATCDKISYVLPDDVQTKSCDLQSSMDFYMCGSEAPDGSDDSSPASSAEPSASSTEQAESSTAAPTSTYAASSADASSADASPEVSVSLNLAVAAAAVTTAPEVKESQAANQKTRTQVVYVTAYEYVNAKRHAHDHARRHQAFHA